MGVLLVAGSVADHTAASYAGSARAGPTAQDASAERGRTLFSVYCSTCHAAAGIPAALIIGPDLTDFQSRPLIAGVVPNTPDNLTRWLANPQSLKPDSNMPPPGLSATQANDLAAFLLPQQGAPEEEPGVPPADSPPSATD